MMLRLSLLSEKLVLVPPMKLYRRKDHVKHLQLRCVCTWAFLMRLAARRSSRRTGRTFLLQAVRGFTKHANDYHLHHMHVFSILKFCFHSTFANLANERCLEMFRFNKCTILKLTVIVGLPSSQNCTSRNGYGFSPLLSTCILLPRFASPCRWSDVSHLFGKQPSHMSEIFWETLENILEAHGGLLTGDIPPAYKARYADKWARSIFLKTRAL